MTVDVGELELLIPRPLTAQEQAAEIDRTFAERASKGDQDAFAALVSRHQKGVYNLAYRILGDREEARDLTQEAFLRVWRALPTFRLEAKFTTWLYRIVYNLCLNRRVVMRRWWTDSNDLSEAAEVLPAPAREGPAEICEKRELRALLFDKIGALPTKYRLVITLYYLQHFSYDEIAHILDIPLGTVKTHLHRAKEKLRKSLEGEVNV